jgi:hypothetical protein
MKWLSNLFYYFAAPSIFPKDEVSCSFCRKSRNVVGPLVEAPNRVFICDSCIDFCRAIMDAEKVRLGVSAPIEGQSNHEASAGISS